MRKSLFAFLLLLAGPALAQAPLVVRGLPYTGNGVMATSTASTAISGMTVSATGAALPSAFYNLYVINRGTTDVAFCPRGGTCTCPENTVANTDGVTVAAGLSYSFPYSDIVPATATIVACSGTPTVEFQW